MSERSVRARSRNPGPLRTAVVAALVEQPAHGYDLTNRLNQRMGPVLQVDARRVYEALLQLEKEGLAISVEEEAAAAPNRRRRVFSATELALATHEAWLRERQPLPVVRTNLHALIAFSRAEHAPQLLAMLEEYELDCMEMQERTTEPEVEGGSWRSRMIAAGRAAATEQLRAELRWIALVRREIEDHLGIRR